MIKKNDKIYPTSSVFSLGSDNSVNGTADGGTYVAYLWSEVQGFSKISSYIGTGNDDGAFVFLGFRPAFVMIKRTDSTGSWYMWDNKRDTFNEMENRIRADTTQVESTNASYKIDFLSNGFKIKQTNTELNASGGTYIYMAFAEAPFVNSNGVPCNAR